MPVQQMITLPELEALWKWPRMVNPYLSDVENESYQWSASLGAFPPEVHALVHERGKLGEFVPYTFMMLFPVSQG